MKEVLMSEDKNAQGEVTYEKVKENKIQIKTHEQFMREANKQIVENLNEMRKELHAIGNWVLFFGIMAIIGAIVSLISVLTFLF
jgi:hypothetical protein